MSKKKDAARGAAEGRAEDRADAADAAEVRRVEDEEADRDDLDGRVEASGRLPAEEFEPTRVSEGAQEPVEDVEALVPLSPGMLERLEDLSLLGQTREVIAHDARPRYPRLTPDGVVVDWGPAGPPKE